MSAIKKWFRKYFCCSCCSCCSCCCGNDHNDTQSSRKGSYEMKNSSSKNTSITYNNKSIDLTNDISSLSSKSYSSNDIQAFPTVGMTHRAKNSKSSDKNFNFKKSKKRINSERQSSIDRTNNENFDENDDYIDLKALESSLYDRTIHIVKSNFAKDRRKKKKKKGKKVKSDRKNELS